MNTYIALLRAINVIGKNLLPMKELVTILKDLGARNSKTYIQSGNAVFQKCFYLHAPEGIGRSKLAASSEKLLGVSMTDRNWKTVCKIREMAAE